MRYTPASVLRLLTLAVICLGATAATRANDSVQAQSAAPSRDEVNSTKLVTIISPSEGESLPTAPVKLLVKLERRAIPWTFRARLNGQDVSSRFTRENRPACGPASYCLEAAVLPQDNLRRERNKLVVEVAGRSLTQGWAQSSDSHAFFITGPQAEAGEDVEAKVGRRVQLDGGASAGTHPLAHKWSLVRQPEGSTAALANTDSLRPSFVPDVPGTYVFRLVVNDGFFDSAADTVRVSATPAGSLVPINTRILSNDGLHATDYGIQVGDTTYTPDGLKCPDNLIGVQVLTLDRKTTEKLDYKCFATGGSASAFHDYLNTRTSDQLVIVSGLAQAAAPGDKFDASPVGGASYGIDTNNKTYSLIGVKGLSLGDAYENVIGNGSLQGYLVQDTQNNYTFAPKDYITIKVTPGGSSVTSTNSTIRVGDRLYEAPSLPGGAAGGFWVLRLLRSDLNAEASSQTFGTNNPDPNAGQTEMERMASELGFNSNSPTDQFLYLVTTVGAPLNTFPGGQHILHLANALEALGGTGYALQGLYDNRDRTPNYTLVGAVAPQDTRLPRPQRFTSSSLDTDQGETGVVSGVLGRNRLNLFEPVAWADESGDSSDDGVNYEFYQVAWQPPVAWPVPTNAGQQAAYEYISQKLTGAAFGCKNNANCQDLRSYYTSIVDDPCQLKSSLSAVSYPGGGHGFSAEDFAAVYNQLDGDPNNPDAKHELTYACNVHNFSNTATELFTAQNSNVGLILDGVANEIKNDLEKPSDDAKLISGLKITAALARTAGAIIPVPAVKAVAGSMSGVFAGAAYLASSSASGVPTGQFTTKVDTLKTDAAGYFAQVQAGVGLTFANILTDWGKLSSVGQRVGDRAAGWDWDTTTNGHLLAAFNLATRRHYFEQLLPTAYSLDYMWKVERSDPKQVGTTGKGFPVVCYTYYDKRPDASWKGYRTIDVPTLYDLLIITRTQRNHGGPIFPSDALLSTLFEKPAADGTGGLGLVKDTFFSINGPLYPWRPEAEASDIRCYPK